jgi:hypothetical protein
MLIKTPSRLENISLIMVPEPDSGLAGGRGDLTKT